jgi:hypothetical protein
MAERRRASLTPLESELRATDNEIAPASPTLVTRLQRRFGGRERRFNLGIAYIGAGAVVIGIGVVIEALTGR